MTRWGGSPSRQDWLGDGTNAAYDRSVTYNGKGQIQFETVVRKQGSSTITSDIRTDYGLGVDYALGAAVTVTVDNERIGTGAAVTDTSVWNQFAWYDGAVVSSSHHDSNTATTANAIDVTSHGYSAFGHLASISVGGARPRTISLTNDLGGQAIRRDEQDNVTTSGDPHEVWYRFAGREMGHTTNNGGNGTSYWESVENRTREPVGGAFRHGWNVTKGTLAASLDPITSYDQGSSAGSYRVREGDTLSSVAAQLWGDSSLWYKLAEANGMSAANGLVEGQNLTVPPGVMRNTHNASTFRPYDPSEALGDTSPTAASTARPPKRNKCGMFGQVLIAAAATFIMECQ